MDKSDIGLYLVTDRKLFPDTAGLLAAIGSALAGGLKAVQLREKDLATGELLDLAYRMRDLTSQYGARLFINDRLDIAISVGADGVHLGHESMPVRAAKKVSEGRLAVAVSTHSVLQAKQAEAEGADFITLGPVFDTASKRQYGRPVGTEVLKEAASTLSIPVLAIGGITPNRVAEVMSNGASGIALISAILTADDIQNTTEEFMRKLK